MILTRYEGVLVTQAAKKVAQEHVSGGTLLAMELPQAGCGARWRWARQATAIIGRKQADRR